MIRSLWIAKTGMEGQQTKLDAISNNLANVGTNGFKRAGVVFEDLMYQNLRQTLHEHLSDRKVFKLGTGQVKVYIVGKSARGLWLALATEALET